MKTNLENNLEQILNLPVEAEIADVKEVEILEKRDDTKDQDFEIEPENVHDIISQGKRALDELCDIANASQHPRAYEVVSTLIKTLSDANSNLMNIQKQKKELDQEEKKGPNKVTNNLFVGSTAGLQKIINPRKEIDNG